jgi:moderate conductance mechanosensitive channel
MWQVLRQYAERLGWDVVVIKAIRIVLILVLAWVILVVAQAVLRGFKSRLIRRIQYESHITVAEATKRADTLTNLLRQGIVIGVTVVTILMLLSEIGIQMGPVIASAGVLGVALGFGAQTLVRDVIAGFFMVFENQVRVGDVAQVNNARGLVEQINFRTLVLRDMSGIVHVIPNGSITTLANLTKDWSAYVFDIQVAYREDTDRIVEIMRDVGDQLRADADFSELILSDIEIFGVDKLADTNVVIKARIKTVPIKQWEVGREYLRRLKKAFVVAGVDLPVAQAKPLVFNSEPLMKVGAPDDAIKVNRSA